MTKLRYAINFALLGSRSFLTLVVEADSQDNAFDVARDWLCEHRLFGSLQGVARVATQDDIDHDFAQKYIDVR